jgi:hypothetical protein
MAKYEYRNNRCNWCLPSLVLCPAWLQIDKKRNSLYYGTKMSILTARLPIYF